MSRSRMAEIAAGGLGTERDWARSGAASSSAGRRRRQRGISGFTGRGMGWSRVNVRCLASQIHPEENSAIGRPQVTRDYSTHDP